MINPKKVHEIHNLSLYYLWNIHTLSIILGLDKCWIKLGSLFHPLFIQIHSLSKLCPRITFSWSKRPIFALSIGYPNPFFIQILSKVYFHMTQETDPCFIQYLSKSFLCLNFVQGLLSFDPRDLSWFYPLFIQIHSLSKLQSLSKVYFQLSQETAPCFIHGQIGSGGQIWFDDSWLTPIKIQLWLRTPLQYQCSQTGHQPSA